MIFERGTGKGLGESVGAVQTAGNMLWKRSVALSEVPHEEVSQLDMLGSLGYFGRVLT